MLHITDDGFGGFLVFEEPDMMEDLEGGATLLVVAAVSVTTLLMSVMVNPDSFRDALCCLLIGLFINAFFRGGGSLPFLRPLALPFYTAFVLSATYSLVTNASDSPTMGLLMLPLSALFALAASFAVFGRFFGDCESAGVTFVLGVTVISWIEAQINNKNFHTSDVIFYLMRIITLIAALWALVIFVQWLIALFRGNLRPGTLLVNLALAGAGVVPVFGMSVLGPAATGSAARIILSLAFVTGYILLAVFGMRIARRRMKNVEGTPDVLLMPLLICAIFYYARGALFHVRSEVIEGFTSFLRQVPLYHEISNAFQAAIDCFGTLFGEIAYGVASLVARIFDASLPRFTVPPFVTFVLMMALLIAGVLFLPDLVDDMISAHQKKKHA